MKPKTRINIGNLKLFRVAARMRPEIRNEFMKQWMKTNNDDEEIYRSLREISVNTLNGNIKLPKQIKMKLKPHMSSLKKIAKTKTRECSCKSRRRLIQRGTGFWLPLILPIIAQTIFSKIIGD